MHPVVLTDDASSSSYSVNVIRFESSPHFEDILKRGSILVEHSQAQDSFITSKRKFMFNIMNITTQEKS